MKNACLAILIVGLLGGFQAAGRCRASDPAPESIQVRYALASLELAQMDLDKAVQTNKPIAGILPESAIEPLRQVVSICEDQLREARRGTVPSARDIETRAARIALAVAQADYEKAAAANKAAPGLVSNRDLRRLQVVAEVARLRLELAATMPAQAGPEQVQAQLRQLSKDVLELRSRVERLSVRE